jgi:hypothetical protein
MGWIPVLCFKPDGQKGQEGEGPVDLIRKRTGDKKSQEREEKKM